MKAIHGRTEKSYYCLVLEGEKTVVGWSPARLDDSNSANASQW